MPPRRPKRRPQAREISCSASPSGWVSPVALRFRLGHRPVIHRAHPAAPRGVKRTPWGPLPGIPLTQTAGAAALVGAGTCYESPVTETPGLQGCLEDHATGTVQDMGPARRRHDPPEQTRGPRGAGANKRVWKGLSRPCAVFGPAVATHCPDLVTTTITARWGQTSRAHWITSQ